MSDLSYLVRRDKRDLDLPNTKKHYKSPLQREVLSRRAKLQKSTGYRSRVHVAFHLAHLCDTVGMRHGPEVSDEIRDVCEDVTSEHESSVVDAFADTTGKDTDAIHEVCVSSADMCDEEEYRKIRSSLASFHLNQPGGVEPPQKTQRL